MKTATFSGDWTFCENWRDLGGRVWVDKRVLLKHTGTYVFDFQTQDKLYQDLHSMALSNQSAQQAAQVPADAVQAPVAKVIAKSTDKKKSKSK